MFCLRAICKSRALVTPPRLPLSGVIPVPATCVSHGRACTWLQQQQPGGSYQLDALTSAACMGSEPQRMCTCAPSQTCMHGGDGPAAVLAAPSSCGAMWWPDIMCYLQAAEGPPWTAGVQCRRPAAARGTAPGRLPCWRRRPDELATKGAPAAAHGSLSLARAPPSHTFGWSVAARRHGGLPVQLLQLAAAAARPAEQQRRHARAAACGRCAARAAWWGGAQWRPGRAAPAIALCI